VRIAIADDSALIRSGLTLLLRELGFTVVGSVATGQELLQLLHGQDADAAIVDIRMPPTFTDEGLQAAQAVRRTFPQVAVLLLSTYANSSYAARLLETGRHKVGYLLKDRVEDPASFADSLKRLVGGECVIEPELITALLGRERAASYLTRLTERERDVLRLMAEGRSNAGIGRELYLSQKTVEAHIASVFAKLDMVPDADENRRVRAVLAWLRGRD
jgi:DNA-binding NarL/FixJ family response regulator